MPTSSSFIRLPCCARPRTPKNTLQLFPPSMPCPQNNHRHRRLAQQKTSTTEHCSTLLRSPRLLQLLQTLGTSLGLRRIKAADHRCAPRSGRGVHHWSCWWMELIEPEKKVMKVVSRLTIYVKHFPMQLRIYPSKLEKKKKTHRPIHKKNEYLGIWSVVGCSFC